ncbi:MAG: hypothetical protein QNK11_00525 [Legionella sp.]|nr:hypothetical protein [Legionella sp.]
MDDLKLFKRFDSELPVKAPGDFSWFGFPEADKRKGVMSRETLLGRIAELKTADLLLNGNALGNCSFPFLLEILTSLSSADSVTHLALMHNLLDKQSVSHLVTFFSRIPPAIQILDISHNRLGKTFDFQEFQQVMAAIPETVHTINLYKNQFGTYEKVDRERFLEQFSDRFNFQPTGSNLLFNK